MDVPTEPQVTLLLQRARTDREGALADLFPLVQSELRRIAGGQMSRERREHTLQPTALVNEAYLRLADAQSLDWRDRAQFLALAARVMRQVLVDHARKRGAKKRGGDGARMTLDEGLVEDTGSPLDLLDLHEKLELLRGQYERCAKVVELRFFGGLTFEESGHVLEISPRTVESDWHFARSWLRREMRVDRDHETGREPHPGR